MGDYRQFSMRHSHRYSFGRHFSQPDGSVKQYIPQVCSWVAVFRRQMALCVIKLLSQVFCKSFSSQLSSRIHFGERVVLVIRLPGGNIFTNIALSLALTHTLHFREGVRLVVDFTNISLSLIIAQIHIIWRRPLWTGILFGLSMDLLPKLPHYLSPGGVRKATKFVVSNPPLCLSLWTSPVEGGVWRSFVEQEQE